MLSSFKLLVPLSFCGSRMAHLLLYQQSIPKLPVVSVAGQRFVSAFKGMPFLIEDVRNSSLIFLCQVKGYCFAQCTWLPEKIIVPDIHGCVANENTHLLPW